MTIILENIRSSFNVGSIFRTCDALKLNLILIGYTPKPTDKYYKLIQKTALGSLESVNWKHFDNSNQAFDILKNKKHYSIEINSNSKDIFTFLLNLKKTKTKLNWNNTCLWFGNEVYGLSNFVLSQSKEILHLKMYGNKESLNISNCVTAVGYLLKYFNVENS